MRESDERQGGESAPSITEGAWRLLAFGLFLWTGTLCGQELKWQAFPGYRAAVLTLPPSGRTGFSLLSPAETGLVFTNELSDLAVARNRILENGSGVALGDVDGDGLCDVYLCRLEGDNVLFRNLGNWKFEDITSQSGVACSNQYSTGAVLADIDGDGDLDLLVNSIGGGTRCFFNDGKSHFTELTDSRLVHRFGSTSMALADTDGDGDLDLYVVNYSTVTHRDNPPGLKVEARMKDGKVVMTPEDRFIPFSRGNGGVEAIEVGERDFLYVNDGHGRFLPVSWTAGSFLDERGKPYTAAPHGWGFSVAFRDLNGDGLPDLYVCNDFFYFPDDIWLNVGGTHFQAASPLSFRHVPVSSMAVDVADINRDGFVDLFVVDMVSRQHSWRHRQRPQMFGGRLKQPLTDPMFRPETPRNTLFLNRGDQTWVEIAQLSGLENTEWSWGAVFLDVDLDGWEDLLIPTGNNHDVQNADLLMELGQVREAPSVQRRERELKRFGRLEAGKLAFRNQHDLSFREMSQEWGFNQEGISHGMALADLDNDGDLDVVVNNLHGNASLYRNDSIAPRVAVRLHGDGMNTRGIGARIELKGGPVTQSTEMTMGGRYLSNDDTVRTFASSSSNASTPMSLTVSWRSGRKSVIANVLPNRVYEVNEQEAGPKVPFTSSAPPGPSFIRFQDTSALLQHTNQDEPFDDFARQPLLSHSLSARGPGVAWCDLDGDGLVDLAIGAGRNGLPAIFRNLDGAHFTNVTAADVPLALWDQGGWVAGVGREGKPALLVASQNYDGVVPLKSAVDELDRFGRRTRDVVPAWEASAGPLALADLDGDGNLDLFVGGRVLPSRHPEPASSKLFRSESGVWVLDSKGSEVLKQAGLVSAAVFADLDGDGSPELILACEWGPLRVFRVQAGQLEEVTQGWGLAPFTGWWNGVTVGDFDGDGRLDLVASNWGRNTRYQSFLSKPIEVVFADFDQKGRVAELETYFESQLGGMAPWRTWDDVTEELPWIRERYNSFRSFGEVTIGQILGDRMGQSKSLQATTLDSMVFLNRGGRFDPRPLPIEAQFAPAFAVCVADFDNDGKEDVFLSQNFFGVPLETARYDGGRGLILRGNGDGSFAAVESGIEIYGEQRGAAVADYDNDGRADLVVTQNQGATRLFRNIARRVGLRVRLRGSASNPDGIGCQVRVGRDGNWGPVREIHAGSGYWSQDSTVLVMGSPEVPDKIQVRWPGGKTVVKDLPRNARTVEMDLEGELHAK